MKHLKHGTLAKFDGTVKRYPAFKKNFFELVYAQRIGYLHKLMALEYMVPEKLQTRAFWGPGQLTWTLWNAHQTPGTKVWGQGPTSTTFDGGSGPGQDQTWGSSRIPYAELLEVARHVDSHLTKSAKLAGAGDSIIVSLRELVPHHIKSAYTMEMKRCGAEENGASFLKVSIGRLDGRDESTGNQPQKDRSLRGDRSTRQEQE